MRSELIERLPCSRFACCDACTIRYQKAMFPTIGHGEANRILRSRIPAKPDGRELAVMALFSQGYGMNEVTEASAASRTEHSITACLGTHVD